MSVRPILFALLRSGLNFEREAVGALSPLFDKTPDWKKIYKESSRQGVLAIAYDGLDRLIREGVIPAEKQPSRTMKLQWACNVMQIEQRYARQRHTAGELAEAYGREGIRTVVLKGIAVAQYYPREDHRPCGDLDCFLMGDYERGNRIAEELGAEIEDGGYKHSHIDYKHLTVENHQFLTSFDATNHGRRVEKELQRILTAGGEPTPIGATRLLAPNATFTALFLLKHAQNHFLDEGLSLRHLLDWLLFLHEGPKVDWRGLEDRMEWMHLRAFAGVMTAWCARYFGGEGLPRELLLCDEYLLEDFDRDIFAIRPELNEPHWWQKIPRILRRFRRMWHFRVLLNESYAVKLWNTFAYSSYLHRRPTL